MKIDEIRISVNGNDHIIGVEKCMFQAKRRIFLDNRLYVKYKRISQVYTYYNINIDGKTIILAIYNGGWGYKYDVYIDGVSINDGSKIDKKRKDTEETVYKGFWNYCRLKKINAFIRALLVVCIIEGSIIIGDFKDYGKLIVDKRFMFICFAVYFLLLTIMFLFDGWIDTKKDLKNWDKQFEPVRKRKEKYYM
jgi:hypothetical protein